MPYTKESAITKADATQTVVALTKLRLFKNSFVPTVDSVKADFVAAEADYDGYTAGGLTVTAFGDPFFDPAGGASIISPLKTFAYVDGVGHVGNMIGGWWLDLAAGDLWCYGTFPAPVALSADGMALNMTVTLNEGRN